jgi:hypothetical protein
VLLSYELNSDFYKFHKGTNVKHKIKLPLKSSTKKNFGVTDLGPISQYVVQDTAGSFATG